MENNFFRSRWFGLALKIFIALVAALLIFQLGMYVGFRKASFSYGWGDNYNRIFGGPVAGMMRGFTGKDMMNGHGTAGTIASISDDGFIIKGGDGVEKMITISAKTSITSGRTPLKPSDLRLDDRVTVIGQPKNDGTVNAEIIRVFGAASAPVNVPPAPTLNY
jgi:hypothetical protein